MKKVKIILLLMLLGIVFAFSTIMLNKNLKVYAGYNDDIEFDYENVNLSEVWGKIHIDDTNPSMNWSVAKKDGICTGNGTYSDPYVIQDLVIDGGGSGSCILIENSNVYFRIENCTVYNAGIDPYDAGIRISYVKNSQLIDNNCSSNYYGIRLDYSDNNTISGNTANDNVWIGISLGHSDNNIISENKANDNNEGIKLIICHSSDISRNNANDNNYEDIYIDSCDYNTISENTCNNSGDSGIYLSSSNYNNISGNSVNHNTKAGIFTYSSNNNNILGNIVNNNYWGMKITNSDNNDILGNTINTNEDYGIFFRASNYNTVSGNELLGNLECIKEINCKGNEFSDNKGCKYGEGDKEPIIPGYNVFFLLGILSVVTIFISKKLMKY